MDMECKLCELLRSAAAPLALPMGELSAKLTERGGVSPLTMRA